MRCVWSPLEVQREECCIITDQPAFTALFDMDQALMQLRMRDGESAEALALTGTYHNLLRQWADT